MKKRVANRGVAWLFVMTGAIVVAGSGCSALTSYVDKNDAGVKDGGKTDGKVGIDASASRKDAGSSSKGGASSSSDSSVGGATGGAGDSSQVGGQISSSTSDDAGVDAPVGTGGIAGASASVAGAGGASVVGGTGGTVQPMSIGGSTPPASSGGNGGSNSRDAGFDLGADRPVNPTVCTTAATCPAPTGGNGVAVCQGGTCGMTCNTGYHRCGNSCLSETSAESCGSSCGPCPKPASNGSATCAGTPLACGVRCDLGFHACGSSCVVNGSTSTNSCGNSCAACTAPANGSVTCNGRSCVQACNTGYHLCNGACLPNNSVEGCGTASCTPCRVPPNGSPTCNGTSCGFECNSNYHKCGNNCASNTDPNNCGSTCKLCAGDLNGNAACVAGECAVQCKTGYHWCANIGRCVVNASNWPGSCGNNCTVCPTATGAVATCDGTKCGLEFSSCENGLALCGTDCVVQDDKHCGPTCKDCTALTAPTDTHMVCEANACVAKCNGSMINCAPDGTTPLCVSLSSTSLEHCGGSCTACPNPGTLGSATCTGTPLKCGIGCGSTAHLCSATGTTCYANDDLAHCGSASGCEVCSTAPSSAELVCSGNKCDFKCITGYHRCDKDPSDPCKKDDNSGFCGASCEQCSVGDSCIGGVCTTPTSSGSVL
jgi:hypothetical protein